MTKLLLSAHYLLTTCSLSAHYPLTTRSLSAHYPLTICSLSAHYLLTICSLSNFAMLPLVYHPIYSQLPLAKGTGDDTFLTSFKQVVKMAINLHRPDLVIYDVGVDLHRDDELGYLDISTEAIYLRDLFLLKTMQDNHIPVAAVVGGGYRTEQQELVPVHFQLIQAALNLSLDLDSDLLKNKVKTQVCA
ncbi:arginase family protein [Shewanella psychropiezotolerans]|uniref:hypothetical protein n=1 Tax=Shewanella psychropiezotolerans TaxID=2593655 RepID=UPI001E51AC28|nr:hypothetical protein [Shewanella psychropiezotolerans]